MKLTLRKILSLICVIAVILNIHIPIQAAGDPSGVLYLDTDTTNHQALKMTVDSVASQSPFQAFCVGWTFTFSNVNGSVSVYVPLSEIDTNGGRRTYTFPMTTGWTKEFTGINGGKSIRDMVSNKTLYDSIIKDGCAVHADARIRKYSFSNGTYTPLNTYANSKAEIDSNFSEFTAAFKTNTKTDYFDLYLTLLPEPLVLPDPKVNLTMPVDGSTVLQGTTVIFKGFGTGVHHIGGFVNGSFYGDEQNNPNSDINVQMKYETTVKLDQVGDYTFQLKGRNTPLETNAGSKLAESAIHTVHVVAPAQNTGTIHVANLDYETNNLISDYTIPNVSLNTPYSVTRQLLSEGTFKGSYKTNIPSANKSKMTSDITQTVTLTDEDKDGYVYFWYEGEKPIPPVTYPPVAVLSNTKIAYEGQDVNVNGGASYDPDGYIDAYLWTTPGAQERIGYKNGQIDFKKSSGTTWYADQGTYNLNLEVYDNDNLTDETDGTVQIIPAIPEANLTVSASQIKENRKIRLDLSGSKASQRFELNWNSASWTIEPIDGTGATGDYGVRLENGTVYKNVNGIAYKFNSGTWTNTGNSFNSILTGQKTVYFQARDKGQYKISATISVVASYNSSKTYSGTISKTITVIEDLPPVANFTTYKEVYRSITNPTDQNKQKYATIPVTDVSSSPDGDTIGTRNWSFRYDSDNDGDFTDEVTLNKYTGSEPFTSGHRLIVDTTNSEIVNILSYDVGMYAPALEVIEEIPDFQTVKELLKDSDYLKHYVKAW